MRRTEALLLRLLALIHKDTGQHTIEVGVEQSYSDAIFKIQKLRAQNDEYERIFKVIGTKFIERLRGNGQ